MVLRRARYIKEIIVSSTKDISKLSPKRLLIVLRMWNDEFALTFMIVYTWRRYTSEIRTIITKYKIAAGTKGTFIIVLRKTDCSFLHVVKSLN